MTSGVERNSVKSGIRLDVRLRARGRREQHIVGEDDEDESDDSEDYEVGRPPVPHRRDVLFAEPFVHDIRGAPIDICFLKRPWVGERPRLMLIYGRGKSTSTPRDWDSRVHPSDVPGRDSRWTGRLHGRCRWR